MNGTGVKKKSYKNYVKAQLNGHGVLGYIDSGNTFNNVISIELFQTLGFKLSNLRPVKYRVSTAHKNSKLSLVGQMKEKIPLQFSGISKTFYTKPVVVRNLSMPFNISGPFLQKNDIDILHTQRCLRRGSESSKLVSPGLTEMNVSRSKSLPNSLQPLTKCESSTVNTPIDSNVYSSCNVIVPPCSLVSVPVRVAEIQKFAMPQCSGLVTIDEDFRARHEMIGMNGFVDANELGECLAVIGNPGKEMKRITKGTRLGSFEMMDQVPGFKTTEDGQEQKTINSLSSSQDAMGKWSLKKKARWLIDQFELNKNPLLSKREDKKKVLALLLRYFDLFSSGDRYGQTDLVEHCITLVPGTQPIKLKNRPLNPAMVQDLKEQLDNWTKQDVIEESSSPWSFQLLPVKKKNGKIRWCIDFRKLNDATIKDAYPLPNIDDLMARLAGNQVFTTLDQTGAYHVVPIKKEDRDKTAFQTPFGLYQFKAMAFGLCNAPSTYSRLIQKVLEDIPQEVALAYLDDTLIVGKNLEDHLSNLEKVLQRFQASGLTLQPSKCSLMKESVDFLGHRLCPEGIRPLDGHLKLIQEWPQPKNIRDVRSFLGKASYYRKFIPNFSRIAAPLSDLTRQVEGQFMMTKEADQAFRTLKKELTSPPILAHPDFEGSEFILDTDWSDRAIGGVLSQVQNGKERVIQYGARKLLPAEQNYSSNKGEMLAVIHFVQKWKYYLAHRPFILRTDHSALKWIRTMEPPRGMIARWLELLSNFEFRVMHREGAKHANADALSRCEHAPEPNQEMDEESTLCAAMEEADRPEPHRSDHEYSTEEEEKRRNLKEAQDQDETIQKVKQWIKAKKKPSKLDLRSENLEVQAYASILENLAVEKDVLVRLPLDQFPDTRICVPDSMQQSLIEAYHANGHQAARTIIQKLLQKYYFPGLYKRVETTVDLCLTCQCKSKGQPPQKHTLISVQEGSPFQKLSIDFVGPFRESRRGNTYLLTVKDCFTRWLEAFPTKKIDAQEVIRLLETEIFARFGHPRQIHSDQGSQFTSRMMQEICKLCDITHTQTPAYNPKSNPVERSHRDLNLMIKAMIIERPSQDWEEVLPACLFALRTARNRSTGFTPHFLLFGREAATPIDLIFPITGEKYGPIPYINEMRERVRMAFKYVRENLKLAVERSRRTYNHRLQGKPLEEGDLVWLYTPKVTPGECKKLTCYYSGPWEVLKKVSDVLFLVRTCGSWNCKPIEVTASIDRLKRYEGSPPTGGQPIDNLTLPDVTAEDEFLEDIGQCQTPIGKAPLPVTFVEEAPEIREVEKSAPSFLPENGGLVQTEAEKGSTHAQHDEEEDAPVDERMEGDAEEEDSPRTIETNPSAKRKPSEDPDSELEQLFQDKTTRKRRRRVAPKCHCCE